MQQDVVRGANFSAPWIYSQPSIRFSILSTMQCVTETFLYMSPLEISKSEKGGRRGVLLPGQERRWARTVFAAEDGSLWVSKRLSQSVRGHPLRIKGAIFTVHTDTKAESISVMTAGWIPVMVKMSRQCGKKMYGIVRYMQGQPASLPTSVKTASVMLQMTSTSLGSSSSPAAQSCFSSVLLGPFVIPWSADAFTKKATVKTSKYSVTWICGRWIQS